MKVALKKLVEIKSGYSPSTFELMENGSIPYVKVEDMNNCTKYQSESREYCEDVDRSVPSGAIIFPKRGAAIMNNKVRITATDICMDTNMMAIIPNGKIQSEFLYYTITHEKLSRIADTSTIPQINNKHINPYKVALPPLPEQKAIADLLSTWDEAIEKTERLVREKEKRFKWLLRELISEPKNTQKNTEWKKVKLGEVCKIASKEKLRSVNGHFLLTVKLHCLGIERNDRIAPKLTERGRPYFQHKSGDFLIGRQNFHNGGFGIIPPELDGGITSNAISCLIVNESKLSKDFLWFQFANPNYYKKIGHVMDGTGQKELSDKQILKLKIRLPRIETQNHIVETLSSAQREVDLLKQLADKYKTQKRGLMQKMLTGEWRVKPEIVNQYMEA
jgi:type I restriction enzyme S subunit